MLVTGACGSNVGAFRGKRAEMRQYLEAGICSHHVSTRCVRRAESAP